MNRGMDAVVQRGVPHPVLQVPLRADSTFNAAEILLGRPGQVVLSPGHSWI